MRKLLSEMRGLGYVPQPFDFMNTFPSRHAVILLKGDVKLILYDKFFEAYHGGKYWVKDKFRSIGHFTAKEIERQINERFVI